MIPEPAEQVSLVTKAGHLEWDRKYKDQPPRCHFGDHEHAASRLLKIGPRQRFACLVHHLEIEGRATILTPTPVDVVVPEPVQIPGTEPRAVTPPLAEAAPPANNAVMDEPAETRCPCGTKIDRRNPSGLCRPCNARARTDTDTDTVDTKVPTPQLHQKSYDILRWAHDFTGKTCKEAYLDGHALKLHPNGSTLSNLAGQTSTLRKRGFLTKPEGYDTRGIPMELTELGLEVLALGPVVPPEQPAIRTATPEELEAMAELPPPETCLWKYADGTTCLSEAKSRGLCDTHRNRASKRGVLKEIAIPARPQTGTLAREGRLVRNARHAILLCAVADRPGVTMDELSAATDNARTWWGNRRVVKGIVYQLRHRGLLEPAADEQWGHVRATVLGCDEAKRIVACGEIRRVIEKKDGGELFSYFAHEGLEGAAVSWMREEDLELAAEAEHAEKVMQEAKKAIMEAEPEVHPLVQAIAAAALPNEIEHRIPVSRTRVVRVVLPRELGAQELARFQAAVAVLVYVDTP